MKLKAATLSLGNRPDAATWEKGCAAIGLDIAASVRKGQPSPAEVRSVLASGADWIFLGGHFIREEQGELCNDQRLDGPAEKSVSLFFSSDRVDMVHKGSNIDTFKQGDGFDLHTSADVVLWGGCSVCDSPAFMKSMRKLFGAHTLLGFKGLIGPSMVNAMLGGGFMHNKHFFKQVSGGVDDKKGVALAWMRAAQAGYGGGSIENQFRAVDAFGQGWKLSGGKIVKWETF